MFMKPDIVLEYSPATATIEVTGLIVFLQVIVICKVFTTILTIMVAGALNPVLFQHSPRGIVNVAVTTDVMCRRVSFVLMKSSKMWKISIATITVSHCTRCRQCRELILV